MDSTQVVQHVQSLRGRYALEFPGRDRRPEKQECNEQRREQEVKLRRLRRPQSSSHRELPWALSSGDVIRFILLKRSHWLLIVGHMGK